MLREISTCRSEGHELYELQQRGAAPAEFHAAAAEIAPLLEPIPRDRLVDRLTALGMLLAPNRPAPEARIWIAETSRLLGDLPEDILCGAIDEMILGCKFLPTISEIRERADPPFEKRQRQHARLLRLAKLVDTDVVMRKVEPPAPETRRPLKLAPPPDHRPRNPTRQDYIALGVDPAILDATH